MEAGITDHVWSVEKIVALLGLTLVAALVRGERHGAEPCARTLAGLSGGEAAGHELSRFTLDVEGELVVELALDSGGSEEGADAQFSDCEETWLDRAQANFMMRSIAADIRSHSLASTAS